MLLTFLLALTLGGEQPLAPLRTGSPQQYIRNVGGVVSTPAGNWLVTWSNGDNIAIATAGADGRASSEQKLVAGIDAALGSTVRGPILLWSTPDGVFAAPLGSDGRFNGAASKVAPNVMTPLMLACNDTRCIAVAGTTAAILDADARVLSSPSGTPRIAAVAADPNGFLVLRVTPRGLNAERLDQTGAITMAALIPNSSNRELQPADADFDGQRYAIFYPDKDSTLLGVTLALDGTLSAPRSVYRPLLGMPEAISVAWNGSEHLLAVSDVKQTGFSEGSTWASVLVTQRLDRDLAPAAPAATLADTSRLNYYPRAAAGNGGKFFVGWRHTDLGSIVRGAQIVGGAATQTVFSVSPIPQFSPALAAADDRDLALWIETGGTNGITTLFQRRLLDDASSRVLAEAFSIAQPAASSIGSDWLTVWTEPAGSDLSNPQLHGAIITPFSDQPQRLAFAAPGFVEGIAAGANGWMLLVSTGGRLQAVRVTRAGQVFPPADVFVPATRFGAIAWNGAHFLAVTADGTSGARLALLDTSGQVVAAGHLDAPNSAYVAAAASRGDFIVAAGGSGQTSFWRVAPDLASAFFAGKTSGSTQSLKLIPFGTGLLATWSATALRLDAAGQPLGEPTVFDSDILAITPHGAKANAIFAKLVPTFLNVVQQLVLREITEQDSSRRRALR